MIDLATANPFIYEGQVVFTADPDQMGRVKVWVPALDGENFDIDHLPWAYYASPLAGFTVDFPAGNGTTQNDSHMAYGFWAIPKIGATVLILCLAGDATHRYYFASTYQLHRNRSLPAGRNVDGFGQPGPFGDAGDGKGHLNKVEPAYDNLRAQFNGNVTASEAMTRGAYERQVAQPKQNKDGTEGYGKSPIPSETYLESQTFCFTSPGRHGILMQDDPRFSRLRIKTAEGHQIIFDDANERIYVSTARGASWVELDLDGHINVYGSQSISIRSGKDINLFADNNINLEAGQGINMKADGADIRASSKGSIHLNSSQDGFFTVCGNLNQSAEGSLKISSQQNMDVRSLADMTIGGDRGFDMKAGENMRLGAARIDLNGPPPRTAVEAACAELANDPTVVPGHEPWTRPVSGQRGPNWKP